MTAPNPGLPAPAGPPSTIDDVATAVAPIAREFMLAAAQGPFPATSSLHIARRSARFRGGDTAARAHATTLANIGLLAPDRSTGSLIYSLAPKGARLLATVAELGRPSPARVRTESEARLLAVVARVDSEDLDVLDLDAGSEYELIASLSDRARVVARRHVRMRIVQA